MHVDRPIFMSSLSVSFIVNVAIGKVQHKLQTSLLLSLSLPDLRGGGDLGTGFLDHSLLAFSLSFPPSQGEHCSNEACMTVFRLLSNTNTHSGWNGLLCCGCGYKSWTFRIGNAHLERMRIGEVGGGARVTLHTHTLCNSMQEM